MSCGSIYDSVKIIASEILTLLETIISVVLFPIIEAIIAREEVTMVELILSKYDDSIWLFT
jgi:hypothetical protein